MDYETFEFSSEVNTNVTNVSLNRKFTKVNNMHLYVIMRDLLF